MAIAFVQRVDAATFVATTLTINIALPTEGNLLVGTMFTRGATATNPTGFTTAVEVINTTNDDRLRIVYKIAGASEADPQWTGLTTGDSNGTVAAIYEFSGTDTSTPLDQTASTGETTATQTISSGTTGTLSQADEVGVAMAGLRVDATGTTSWDNAFTAGTSLSDTATQPAFLMDSYKIVSATTALQTDASWTGSTTAIAAIATFKAAGGAAAVLNIAPIIQNYRNMRIM